MTHPYLHIAPYQRWRSAMVDTPAGQIDPVVEVPWRIKATDRVATAGSCFAQHLTRHMRQAGLAPFETEPAHALLSHQMAEDFGYGIYSARYGNVYTSRQLLQLFQRAYGSFVPKDDAWAGANGTWFDPFRPTIQPAGFSSKREYDMARKRHFAAVRAMFEGLDVFVFTLGLTECWSSREDGAVYPLCPGVAAGQFDPQQHVLINLTLQQMIEDLDAFWNGLRAVNPKARMIMTVSPGPIAATAEDRHVLTANGHCKAALRMAAEEISQRPGVIYFPSYEIITSPASRGAYYGPNLRAITEAGVEHVMRVFFTHLVDAAQTPASPPPDEDTFIAEAQRIVDVLCDEDLLDNVT